MPWKDRIKDSPALRNLTDALRAGGAVSARGAIGSSTTVVASMLRVSLDRPILLVVAHLDDADEACDELESRGVEAVRFPALEMVTGESGASIEILAERMKLVQHLHDARPAPLIVAPIQALMQAVPPADHLARWQRSIKVGDTLEIASVMEWLVSTGYQRVDAIENAGEFAARGGILDIHPPGGVTPLRIDFFGDEVDSLNEIDLDTMGSDRRIESVQLVGASLDTLQPEDEWPIMPELLPPDTIAVLNEVMELTEQGRGYHERVTDARGIVSHEQVFAAIQAKCHAMVEVSQFARSSASAHVELPVRPLPEIPETISEAVADLAAIAASGGAVTVLCQNQGERDRMGELLQEFAQDATIDVEILYLHRGFIWEESSEEGDADSTAGLRLIALVPYHELLHRYQTRRRIRKISTGRAMDTFLDLEAGDLVVHRDHGIARFVGIAPLTGRGAGTRAKGDQEYLTLEFAGSAKLYVPASDIELVQKYVGAFKGKPQLSKIGGKRWKKQKESVAEAVRDLATEMLQIQAVRQSKAGIRFPPDTAWQREFEAEFPYEETEDQVTAIHAVKRDMNGTRPMDRLICGDVGFGKTEVAIRAAFKAAEYGRQVAVLVPTTVLAEQHGRTFRDRFAGYPMRVESISRFRTKKEQEDILKEVAAGRVDVIIGTHRLLSRDVRFADLGLVIIDEEQRFGVEHKHRLLEFRLTADVLTLSATPIPRTLHMSLLGLRDISSLATPPADRRSIVTEVCGYDKRRIKHAIERELAREGQVFFVHNRVHNIQSIADDVRQLAPDARIVIGHGQMPSRQLEKVMLTFMRRQADILVCTTIIESGIDIPTANTMFINDADIFGLSDLHQLRGRVGRYKHRAYCYLLLPPDRTVNETAVRRLKAIEDYNMLGAGFKIAMRDLEIRGAGNLLGAEQSGHITIVGYEMYCQLLQQAVRDLKGDRSPLRAACVVDLGFAGALTKGYIPSDLRRMEAYRRISRALSIAELDEVRRDLLSAYGEPPTPSRLMLNLAEVRILASHLGVVTLKRHEKDLIFLTPKPSLLEQQMRDAQGALRAVGQPNREGQVEIYYRPPAGYLEPDSLLAVLRRRLAPADASEPAAAAPA